jgi:pyrimidine-specific ribonucleoside hydrolase
MFIVPAEVIMAALQLPIADEGGSSIDNLFAQAKENSELTSVALVSLEELLRGAFCDGKVVPLSTRQLDDKERSSKEIWLRQVMVGHNGSLCTLRDALETFVSQPHQATDLQLPRVDVAPVSSSKTAPAQENWVPDKNFVSGDQVLVGKQPASVVDVDLHAGKLKVKFAKQQKETWVKIKAVTFAPAMQTKPKRNTDSAMEETKPKRSNRWNRPDCRTGYEDVSAPSCNSLPRAQGTQLTPYVFDMETGDPDDVLTLLFLGSHPDVELRAVTITPGSREQVALVRWLLQQMGLTHVRLGAQDWPANANKAVNLNTSFYQNFGRSPIGEPECERADQVLVECCDENTTLVTGAPLHNLGDALKISGFRLGRWVAQGGFAGEGVVPPDKQMDKFRGMRTCSTWNFGGCIPAAQAALASMAITRKVCVSKNVCHSVYYDDEFHGSLRLALQNKVAHAPESVQAVAFQIMYDAMDRYLKHKPQGKKLHDPLALATALDESVCELVEVDLFCQKGQWGARLSEGSNILISIAYNASKFKSALLN